MKKRTTMNLFLRIAVIILLFSVLLPQKGFVLDAKMIAHHTSATAGCDTAADCAPISANCFEHCLSSTIMNTSDVFIVIPALAIILVAIFTLCVFFVSTRFIYQPLWWHPPRYFFETVRLLE